MKQIQIQIQDNNDKQEALSKEQIKVIHKRQHTIKYRLQHIQHADHNMVYRQGDIVLTKLNINAVANWLDNLKDWTLCHGDNRLQVLHSDHIIHDPLAYQLQRFSSDIMNVAIDKPTVITHRQHASLSLEPGIYNVHRAGLPSRPIND